MRPKLKEDPREWRRFTLSSTAAAALFTLFGIIHSPYGDGRLFLPWNLAPLAEAATGRGPIEMALAYALLATLFVAWGMFEGKIPGSPPQDPSS